MDATCKIQDGIHMPRIIKKCVQDSGYISYDLKIINILDKDNLDYYTSSPEEFLYLIKNLNCN